MGIKATISVLNTFGCLFAFIDRLVIETGRFLLGKKNVRKPTQREYDFCLAVVKPKTSATDAYLKAYPNFKGTRKTAKENASRLKAKSNIKATIARLRAQVAKPTIMTLQQLGEWWTNIIQNEGMDDKIRVMASNALANFSYKVFERQKIRQMEQVELERELTPSKMLSDAPFAAFCEAHGYPRPYPKQEEMAAFVRAGGARILLGSRGYGKTDYAVICNIAWALLANPADTWLIVTKEEKRGEDILGEIARLLSESGRTFAKNTAKILRLSGHAGKDPNVAVLPLRSKSFRGRHPKHIVCDDLITPDDVSKAERTKVEAVLAELVKLTKNVVLIGQPAHAKDIYAKMRKLAGVKKMEVPYGQIPELDEDLEAQRAAGISEASIQASYFLKISEAERMPFANVEYVNFFPSGTCAGFIDPSHEGNDYTAFAMCARNFDQLIVAGFAWQKAWDDCLEEIVAVMRAFNCARFAFETNGVGKYRA